jgi:K+-sensing histidine kinase KdpD
MQIQNSRKWSQYSAQQAWVGTAAIIFAAFAIRFVLHPYLEPYVPFHFFIVGCLVVQYLFGYKFAVSAVVVSAALGEYYFVQPYNSFGALSLSDLIITINFALVTLAAVAFMEPLQRSLYLRNLLLKVLDSRHKISLYRENDRIFYAQQSNQAWSILQDLLEDFDQILLIKFGDSDYKLEPLFFKVTQSDLLTRTSENWRQAVFVEDQALLEAALAQNTPQIGGVKALALRFVLPSGAFNACNVRVDHFNFMGKKLSILRLAAR